MITLNTVVNNYDHYLRYRDADEQIKTTRYFDYHAREHTRRRVAFFRMSKRGCSFDSTGRAIVDRAVFSKASATVLVVRGRAATVPGRFTGWRR